jgi:hypothetical protein
MPNKHFFNQDVGLSLLADGQNEMPTRYDGNKAAYALLYWFVADTIQLISKPIPISPQPFKTLQANTDVLYSSTQW